MAYVTIKHGNTVLGELNDGDGLKLNTRGTAIDPSTGEYVGLFIREDIEIDVDYPSLYDWGSYSCYPLCFAANTAGSTISMAVNGTPTLGLNFQTSTDKINWTTFTPGTTTITLANIGDKVYFKGNNPNGINLSSSIYYSFTMTGSISASGNIMSLIDNGIGACPTIPNNYCFYRLFYNTCASLTTPPKLSATTLANNCYGEMFRYCASLTIAPELPATTLADSCYSYMFLGCTSLTTTPELPATSVPFRAYALMFYLCGSLINPPTLPAISLGSYSYMSMFEGCTSLTTVPELPATILTEGCYNMMFKGCTGLVNIILDLTVTSVGYLSCQLMFYGCTNLQNAPILGATTIGKSSYISMFYGCTSLLEAPELPATTLADNCYESMFLGCIGLTEPPALPATNVIYKSYIRMFKNCTGLLYPAEMPATTLGNYCYSLMYIGCTNLKVYINPRENYDREWRIPKEGTTSTAAYYSVIDMLKNTGGDFASGTDPSYHTTYYILSSTYTQNILV